MGEFEDDDIPRRLREDEAERKRRLARRLALLCILTVCGLIVWYFVRPPPGDPRAIPACDSAAAIDLAKRGLAGEPVGTIMGLMIVDMSQFTERFSSGAERRCTAQARMNDRTTRTVRYRIKHDDAGHYYAVVDVAAPVTEPGPR